jgi:hypothetical protein
VRFPPEIAPGLWSDDSSHTSEGRWADGSNMRFRLGKPQTIGGWESLISDLLGGVCRSAFAWNDNAALLNIAFGTHATLEVFQGGELFDITPTLAMGARTFTDPYTVTDASTTVTVNNWPSHGLATGDIVAISGGVNVGRIKPVGNYAVTVLDDDSFTFVHSPAADLAETLPADPLTVTSGSNVVTVLDVAHGLPDGLMVTISGATTLGSIIPNGTFAITVIDVDHYKYTFTSPAAANANAGGAAVVITVPGTGGGEVTFAPQVALAPGPVNGAGSAGYGTGAYGIGGYSEPSTSEYFPRTWSHGAFGENLISSPRGGAVYVWTNDTSVKAQPLANAPRQATYVLVTSQDMVMALGSNEEVSGEFNHLCIRTSSVRNNTEWFTAGDTTAREYILTGGGRIVAGRVLGEYVLVWTTDGLFLGTFVGSLQQPYRFDKVPGKGGLIGPGAAVVVGAKAFWVSPDRQFYSYTLGGEITPVPCPIRTAFADNLAPSQGDKIIASSIAEYDEIRIDYPDIRDGSGLENSRYLLVKASEWSVWSRGEMARTAMVDAGPSAYPVGVEPTMDENGDVTGGRIYYHEKGETADGSVLHNYIASADLQIDENRSMFVKQMRPDFQGQRGTIYTTLTVRDEPQGTQYVKGPYSASPGQRKVDMRATGHYAKITYASDYAFRVGNSVFTVEPAGNR